MSAVITRADIEAALRLGIRTVGELVELLRRRDHGQRG
jgi:hypothetical protein